ncbi:MAG: hypothetical protein ACOCZ8_04075 [Bacteroidota bacterium]
MYSPHGVLRRQHYDHLNAFKGKALRNVYGYYWLQDPTQTPAEPSDRGLLLEEAVFLDFGQPRGLVVSAHPKHAAIAVGRYARHQMPSWAEGLGPEWHFVSEGISMQDTWRKHLQRPLTGYQVVRDFGRDVGLFLEFGGPSVLVSGYRGLLGIEGYAF